MAASDRWPRLLALAGLGVALLGLLGAVSGPPRYDRRAWMPRGWIDADGDCQTTRDEVLLRDALPPKDGEGGVQLDDEGCRVVAGRWRDPYAWQVLTSPAEVCIDHVVALDEAHREGGWRWPPDRKAAFAQALDSPTHLMATACAVNSSKGSRGEEAWVPPVHAARCQYLGVRALIRQTWGLAPSAATRAAAARHAQGCGW